MGESPTVRFAYHPQGGATLKDLDSPVDPPVVRLACNGKGQGETNGALGPSVRLAMGNGPAERNGALGPDPAGPEIRPALLVSYVYLKPFLVNRHKYHYRDWVMDSGAFSAHASGKRIDLSAYIDTCLRLKAEDPTLSEVYSLDVIGDWRASLENCETMWARGVSAIPCYHVGEPDAVLKGMAKDYPKIALGGCVGFKAKDKFAAQCFARVWPKRIHGFGFGTEASIMALPWHSVDATNWELGPCKFGRWQSYGQMSVRGSKQNLRSEVEWYLALERRAQHKWRARMTDLDAATTPAGPTVRLAVANGGTSENKTRMVDAFSADPDA